MAAVALVAGVSYACQSGPELTSQQEQGKRIYESLCDKCHKLIKPVAHSDTEWVAAADRYGVKLKLQSTEIAMLKAYLTRANDADFK